jgi:predicted alpha/beta hydrolase family esterase
MTKQVLFLHGAGDGAYEEDMKLTESLRYALGSEYNVMYSAMSEVDVGYEDWKPHMEELLAEIQGPVILVGHSVGGSMLLKYLSEVKIAKPLAGIFLLAVPFWGGDGWRYEGYEALTLPADLEAKLPKDAKVFMYQCQDDEIVPFEHLILYAELLPRAVKCSVKQGGHQFNGGLTIIVQDIKGLEADKR